MRTISSAKQFFKSVTYSRNLPILLITTCWLISVASRFIKSGSVYGMDFSLFHPDGVNYLRFTQDIVNLEIQNSTVYAWSRPLYPLLSLPFFILFGKLGMLVIPSLCYLMLGLTLLQFAIDRKIRLVISALFLIVSCSSTLLRWVVADLTDSLHLALFTLCCLGVYKNWKFHNLLTLVLLGSLARPMGFLWAAMFIACAITRINRRERSYLLLSVLSLGLFLLNTLIMAVFGGFGPNPRSLTEQIASVPFNFITLTIVEFGQLAVMDRVLFYLILFSVVIALVRIRDSWSLIHLCVIFSSFLLSAWIGVWGVNFRYQLPAISTALIVILRLPMLKRMLDLL